MAPLPVGQDLENSFESLWCTVPRLPAGSVHNRRRHMANPSGRQEAWACHRAEFPRLLLQTAMAPVPTVASRHASTE